MKVNNIKYYTFKIIYLYESTQYNIITLHSQNLNKSYIKIFFENIISFSL